MIRGGSHNMKRTMKTGLLSTIVLLIFCCGVQAEAEKKASKEAVAHECLVIAQKKAEKSFRKPLKMLTSDFVDLVKKKKLGQAIQGLREASDLLGKISQEERPAEIAKAYRAYAYSKIGIYTGINRFSPVAGFIVAIPNDAERKKAVNTWVRRGAEDELMLDRIAQAWLIQAKAKKKSIPCYSEIAAFVTQSEKTHRQMVKKYSK